jgi:hypothetical protein
MPNVARSKLENGRLFTAYLKVTRNKQSMQCLSQLAERPRTHAEPHGWGCEEVLELLTTIDSLLLPDLFLLRLYSKTRSCGQYLLASQVFTSIGLAAAYLGSLAWPAQLVVDTTWPFHK